MRPVSVNQIYDYYICLEGWSSPVQGSSWGDGSLTLILGFTPSKMSSGDSDLGVSRLLVSVSLSLPFLPPPPAVCVLMCLLKWSLRMKRLLHTGQAKRFSPVCVRRCLCSSSERVNRLPQKSQLQTKGLSPVCHRRCALRCDVFPYTLPQPGMWQLCSPFLRRLAPAGPSRSASWQFGQSHVALPEYRRDDLEELLIPELPPEIMALAAEASV